MLLNSLARGFRRIHFGYYTHTYSVLMMDLIFLHFQVQNFLGILLLVFPTCTGDDGPLKRQIAPRFLPVRTNITVHRGSMAVLRCTIENLGTKTVVWRKASEEFPLTIGEMIFAPDTGVSVEHRNILGSAETQWDLIIKNVHPKHSGVYECQISATKILTQYIFLNVLKKKPDKPQQAIAIYGTEYLDPGQTLRLICNATSLSSQPRDVQWFFEGQLIDPNEQRWHNRIKISQSVPSIQTLVSELVIQQSYKEDQGTYVCRSSDLDTTSIKVHILSGDIKDNMEKEKRQLQKKLKTSDSSNYAIRNSWSLKVFVLLLLHVVR